MKIFVAGLSRSGKTSRSQHAAVMLQGIDYVSVSQLLVAARRTFPVQTIAEALDNQHCAADLLRMSPCSCQHRIIDGHALIETGEGPMLVPDLFFDVLAPDIIIFVTDLPDAILSRRFETAQAWQVGEIAALSAMEQAACARTAARLRIPLVTLMR